MKMLQLKIMKTKFSLHVGLSFCCLFLGFFSLAELEVFCFHEYILIYSLLLLKPGGLFPRIRTITKPPELPPTPHFNVTFLRICGVIYFYLTDLIHLNSGAV